MSDQDPTFGSNDGQQPETPDLANQSDLDALKDVKQLGLFAAIGSLGWIFWVCGGMEMVERLAFYGVKAVAALYAKDPVSKGGLGITMTQFGTILMVWAFVQSLLPVFTGGLSDRYGYKETIACSTVLKIIGYLLMAWFPTYWGFFAGAIVLAAGTAVFKPGIQGTLVRATSRQNSSMAWGIFYQTVNIGGFLGPLVAGLMRKMEWTYVFYACAAIICLNFLLLLTYKEVGKEERLELDRKVKAGEVTRPNLVKDSLQELVKPHVWTYLLLFSGFWFMFNALFDVLPAHVDDWVNSSDIITSLFPSGKSSNEIVNFFVITNAEGTSIEPEGMLNVNAGLIMLTCFFFAYVSGLMRATTSMVVGTLMASLSLYMCGVATAGWVMLGAIAIFSIGEMLSSPKFLEFIGNFAPRDKKAMYLGFSQIPLAIGWTLEAQIGPWLYDVFASKDRFSRDLLANRMDEGASAALSAEDAQQLADNVILAGPANGDVDLTADMVVHYFENDATSFVNLIPQGEAFDWLVALTGEEANALTTVMYESHNVGMVWYIMAGIGVLSAIGIWIYGKWILTLKKM